MDQKDNKSWVAGLVISAILAIVHFLVFPRTAGPSDYWLPEGIEVLNSDKPWTRVREEGQFFQVENRIGFLTEAGKVPFIFPFETDVSGNAFQVITSNPLNLGSTLFRRETVYNLPAVNSILVRSRFLFKLGDQRLGISRVNEAGTILWTAGRNSPITVVAAGTDVIAVGDLSGTVDLYDKDGKVLTHYQPGGSRLEVIYQLAVSEDDQRVFVMSGIEPKRLIVLEKGFNDYIPVEHEDMEDDRRFSSLLKSIPGVGGFAFTDKGGERLQIRMPRSSWKLLLPVQGEIVDIAYFINEKIYSVVSYLEGVLTWDRLMDNGMLVTRLKIPSSLDWTWGDSKSFHFFHENRLLRLGRFRG